MVGQPRSEAEEGAEGAEGVAGVEGPAEADAEVNMVACLVQTTLEVREDLEAWEVEAAQLDLEEVDTEEERVEVKKM